jgi:hypothetical protein
MIAVLVFLPCDQATFEALAAGQTTGPVSVWTAAPVAAGSSPEVVEEAEHEALVEASLVALTQYGWRLVVVAEMAPVAVTIDPVTPALDGPRSGQLTGLAPRQVTSFFADDPADLAVVQEVGRVIADQPEAAEVIAAYPLMWYDASELNRPLEVPAVDGLVRLN